MSAELQRATSYILSRLGFKPAMAQDFARVLAASNGRVQQNSTLNPTGSPLATDDVKLVGIDGATTLAKGDEVATNRSKALVRPPKQSFHGGLQVRSVVRQEQERQTYLAAVISKTSDSEYQCVLIDRDPPTQVDAATGKDRPLGQVSHNTTAAADADLTPTAKQIAVTVYGDTSAFSYTEGNIIPVQCVRHWKVRTTNQTRLGDRNRKSVVTRTMAEATYYNVRYETGGGG